MKSKTQQNWLKLIKKTTFNRETTPLQIIWNKISSAYSFLCFMERTDHLHFKEMIMNKHSWC